MLQPAGREVVAGVQQALLSRVLQSTAPSCPIHHYRLALPQWAFGLLAKRHGPDFPLRTDVMVSKGAAAAADADAAAAAVVKVLS